MDNLVKRRILATNDQDCTANRGENEDVDHLFYHLYFLFFADYGIVFLVGLVSLRFLMAGSWSILLSLVV